MRVLFVSAIKTTHNHQINPPNVGDTVYILGVTMTTGRSNLPGGTNLG